MHFPTVLLLAIGPATAFARVCAVRQADCSNGRPFNQKDLSSSSTDGAVTSALTSEGITATSLAAALIVSSTSSDAGQDPATTVVAATNAGSALTTAAADPLAAELQSTSATESTSATPEAAPTTSDTASGSGSSSSSSREPTEAGSSDPATQKGPFTGGFTTQFDSSATGQCGAMSSATVAISMDSIWTPWKNAGKTMCGPGGVGPVFYIKLTIKGVTQRVPVTDSCQACTGKDLDLNLEAWNMFYPGVPADKFYEATWEWA